MHMPSAFPILFGIIHVPFDSFISQNEGNAEATQFQPSAIPADRRLDSAAGFATFPTARPLPRRGGRQSHPASEAAGYIPGTPSRCHTTRRTPETSEDNQSQRRDALAGFPSLNAIRGTDVCEGDTHLTVDRIAQEPTDH